MRIVLNINVTHSPRTKEKFKPNIFKMNTNLKEEVKIYKADCGDFIAFVIATVLVVLLIAHLTKPTFADLKDFVLANNKLSQAACGKAEICMKKGWYQMDYYLKCNGQLYSIGYGKWSNIHISDSFQIVNEAIIFDKCDSILIRK